MANVAPAAKLVRLNQHLNRQLHFPTILVSLSDNTRRLLDLDLAVHNAAARYQIAIRLTMTSCVSASDAEHSPEHWSRETECSIAVRASQQYLTFYKTVCNYGVSRCNPKRGSSLQNRPREPSQPCHLYCISQAAVNFHVQCSPSSHQ